MGLVPIPVAAAQAPVGGPPTSDYPRCDRIIRPCGDPIVIGAGTTAFGPIEVVAYTARLGLCVDVDMRFGSSGGCPATRPRSPVDPDGVSGSFSRHGGGYTQLTGTTRPEVAAVRARYLHRGRWHTAGALIARIEGDLQERLGQPKPFGYFVLTVAGCVEAHRFRVTALAADGTVLQRTRGPSFPGLPDTCDLPDMPPQGTSWSRGFGRSSRPTFAQLRPSTRTMSAVKSLEPRSSAEPTP